MHFCCALFTAAIVTIVVIAPRPVFADVKSKSPNSMKPTVPDIGQDTPILDKTISIDHKEAQNMIKDVLAGQEFHQLRTSKSLPFLEKLFQGRRVESPFFWSLPNWLQELILWLAKGIRLLLYCAVIAILLIFILRYNRWTGQFQRMKKPAAAVPVPKTLFGLDLRESSLPTDVPHAVLILWRQNTPREALSLLYRASLARLITHYQCIFHKGHTEGECLALVKNKQSHELSCYFSEVTNQWQIFAYGHRLPDNSTIEKLCRKWPEFFDHHENDPTAKKQ